MKRTTVVLYGAFLLPALACGSAAGTGNPSAPEGTAGDGVHRNVLLPPGPGNPRNSEGDFLKLKDGRLIFIYTHFYGGDRDYAQAHLKVRYSGDGGLIWTTEDELVVENTAGQNVMSVSLYRLSDNRIALFYLRKNSEEDCRPVVRFSDDEARSWSAPVQIVPDEEIGYYNLNNDRVVEISSGPHAGRLIAPLAESGNTVCYYSDDLGATWTRGELTPCPRHLRNVGGRRGLEEPGVVELTDGRLLMFSRTEAGQQYYSHSTDGGVSWTEPKPSGIRSPRSPASIKRIPSTGDLMLVWNDNYDASMRRTFGARTPFNVAISHDDGKTWTNRKTLEDDPHGWYCYTAIYFIEERVLLGHCAGDRRMPGLGLNTTQITSFPVNWLYKQ